MTTIKRASTRNRTHTHERIPAQQHRRPAEREATNLLANANVTCIVRNWVLLSNYCFASCHVADQDLAS